MNGLRGFVPDLLVIEFDMLWGECDGVLATMNDYPQLAEIPVVLITETDKQPMLEEHPKIIARLKHPFQSQELSRLEELLNDMIASRAVASFATVREPRRH